MKMPTSRPRKRKSVRNLLLLPYELLEKIIGYCDHNTLVLLLRTSQKLHDLTASLIYKDVSIDGTPQAWKGQFYSEKLSYLFPVQLFEDYIDRSSFEESWFYSIFSSHNLLKTTKSLRIAATLPPSTPSSLLFQINSDGSLRLGGNLPKATRTFPHKSIRFNPLPSLQKLDITFQFFRENFHLTTCEGPYLGIFELIKPQILSLRSCGHETSYNHCIHNDNYIPFSKSIKSLQLSIDQSSYSRSERLIKTDQLMTYLSGSTIQPGQWHYSTRCNIPYGQNMFRTKKS